MIDQVILILAGSIGGGLGGWLFGRRNKTAEAVSSELGNTERMIGMWEKKADALFKSNLRLLDKVQETLNEVMMLRIENQSLKIEQNNLKVLVEGLTIENSQLKEQLSDLKQTLASVQAENKTLLSKINTINRKK